MWLLVLWFLDKTFKKLLIYFKIQGTAAIIPEEIAEEKDSNLMENHANSTENYEDLKRQIEELKKVSELNCTTMSLFVVE